MKILSLHDFTADFSQCGGKASGLNNLAKAGFNVPKGFVISDIDSQDLTAVTKYYQTFCQQNNISSVAVRSSASNEDGADFSSAGQYTSYLNVSNTEDFLQAVQGCIASLHGNTAQSYMQGLNNSSAKMNVVVQEMIDPTVAGVLFTVSPNNKEHLLIEAVEGLGEALVSGSATSHSLSVPRNASNTQVEELAKTSIILSKEQVLQLFSASIKAETEFGFPLDLEFAISNNQVYWLQARPITVDDANDLNEFDPTYSMENHTITRCNIGEMLPGAVTPLTISTSLYSIDYGMREMLRVSGVIKSVNDLPNYSCALSISNHLFINLTPLYKMDGMVVGAKKDNIELSLCGRALDTPVLSSEKVSFFKQLANGSRYFGFLLSRNKAIKQLTKLSNSIEIDKDASNPAQLYQSIDQLKHLNDEAMTLHYKTSSHSGAMSSAMFQVIDSKISDSDQAKSIIAQLLENIDGIESADILRSLRKLAREMMLQEPNVTAFNTEQLKQFLKQANPMVKTAHQEFLTRHGHRTIREAEMRNKGWADDEESFLSYLKTVIASGGTEQQKNPPKNIKAIIKEHGFKGVKGGILLYLTKQARQGVVNREFSKSKIVKVMDIFKKAYQRLADMLKLEGILPDTDLIFFLTHEEIGRLIESKDFSLVKSAMRRRRQLPEQFELSFKDVNVGKPIPLPMELPDDVSTLSGMPISRGKITAKARVIKSEADARQLQKGEIMVAEYTDIGWSPYYCLIGGLVTEVGSALSHGAVVAREYALPFVSNAHQATKIIRTGDTISVNGYNGEVAILSR